jgi:predicted ribonuclease YlaK
MQGKFVSKRIELAVRAKAAQLLADEEASDRLL